MANFRVLSANELVEELERHSHVELHVHHTWKPNHSDFDGSNHVQLQEAMRNYHVNTLGWSDIGQHITIMPDGSCVVGRDFGRNPASIRGYNEGAFAIELLGNFDKGYDVLEGDQYEAILKLAKYFYGKGKYIRFHRENSTKSCPGSSIDKVKFMQDVKSYEVPKKVDGECSIAFGKRTVEGLLIDGTSYAHVRDISDLLGLEIGWDNDKKLVSLNKR